MRELVKFSMNDLLSDKSKSRGKKEEFKIIHIHISKINPDEKNFYSVDDVEELQDSILLLGLQQPLVVRQIPGTDTYILISGHRRLKAIKKIVEEGNTDFELIPCKVENEVDEIKAELRLIFANSTSRELSDYEKTYQAIRMKELLTVLKGKGIKLNGRLREIVADTLKVSQTQVARMESIDKKLTHEFKEEFKNDNVNISTAYGLSGLTENEQKKAFKTYKEKGTITINDVKDIKTNRTSPQIVKEEAQKTVKEEAKEVTKSEVPQITTHEAIKILRDLNKRNGLGLGVSDSLEMGAKALERDIPVKPVNSKNNTKLCPQCFNSVYSNFCPTCGQAISNEI